MPNHENAVTNEKDSQESFSSLVFEVYKLKTLIVPIYKVLAQRAHQYGLRIARVNARYTSRLAFDGSGWSKRGREIAPETPYALMEFPTGKIYNADLNASYNIGARFFIRHLLKTVTATQRLALEAKVPQVAKRSTCTLSDLINLRSEFVALTTKTQA